MARPDPMTAYDEVPYDCQPIPCTAPEQLAMASLFHGGPCPPVWSARVLEIGCGDGANLLALAYHRPDCRFVGIDASAAQIEEARRSAMDVELENVIFHAADIVAMGSELGTFDYILVHGVMSWVSAEVCDTILERCRDHLAPSGLLYLSYNTHPGWLVRGLVRDTVRPDGTDSSLRQGAGVARIRANSLRKVVAGSAHPYLQLLADELSRVEGAGEAYLIHEYLSEHNRAFWFGDFAALTGRFGFRYVAEAAFTEREYRIPAALREAAARLANGSAEIEQMIDMLCFRQHRVSIFCHGNQTHAPGADALPYDRLTVASGLRPSADVVRLGPNVAASFVGHFEPEIIIELEDPLAKAALVAVARHWPVGIGWDQLLTEANALLAEVGIAPASAVSERHLRAQLRELYARGQVDLRLRQPPPPNAPDGNPVTTPLTRWEAARRAMVTTATHRRLGLTPTDRLIIGQMDGWHSRAAIIGAVAERLQAGAVLGWTAEDGVTVEDWVARELDRNVTTLAAWGLA